MAKVTISALTPQDEIGIAHAAAVRRAGMTLGEEGDSLNDVNRVEAMFVEQIENWNNLAKTIPLEKALADPEKRPLLETYAASLGGKAIVSIPKLATPLKK